MNNAFLKGLPKALHSKLEFYDNAAIMWKLFNRYNEDSRMGCIVLNLFLCLFLLANFNIVGSIGSSVLKEKYRLIILEISIYSQSK